MSKWLVPLDVLARKRGGEDVRLVGGKVARLVWLCKNDFSVPEAAVLSTEAFAHALATLPAGCDPKALLRAATVRGGDGRIAEAREQWLRAELPPGLDEELETFWREFEPRCDVGIAVRSSPSCEDGALVAMSGLGYSRVGVRGRERLAAAIVRTWASIASPAALSYLAARGVKDLAMAVILQRAVVATSSGTMFTETQDLRVAAASERVINATFGLGLRGRDAADSPPSAFDVLRIDSRGRTVDSFVADKPTLVRIENEQAVTSRCATPSVPALMQDDIDELASVAARIERLEAGSWGVEFACDGRKVWIVQARPMTNRAYPGAGDAQTVWSNSHIGEALPNVVTPFTWSVIAALGEQGLRQTWKMLGCAVPRGAHFFTQVRGRPYLNLSQFLRIALQVPFIEPRTFVELGGAVGSSDLVREIGRASKGRFLLNLPFTAVRLAKMQLAQSSDVATFEGQTERELGVAAALDLAILPDDGVARALRDSETLLLRGGTLMLACAATVLGAHLALRAVLERVAPLSADRLAEALASGRRELETSAPGFALAHLAQRAALEPDIRAVFAPGRAPLLSDVPEGPTRRALDAFLENYGARAIFEAELSTQRWSEDPGPILALFGVFVRAGQAERSATQSEREEELDRAVERLHLVDQAIARRLVTLATRALEHREKMRSFLSRILASVRRAAIEADRRLARRHPELEEVAARGIGSAFFLTLDELSSVLQSPRTDTVGLIRARRADYDRSLRGPAPPQTFVGAPPPIVVPPSHGQVFRGTSAAGGVAEGRVRVITRTSDIAAFEAGEVLVAHAADLGLTPLFLAASAVVLEIGGALSHTAAAAREYGVPCVVNLEGATLALRTGDHIRVDGNRGVVEHIERTNALSHGRDDTRAP